MAKTQVKATWDPKRVFDAADPDLTEEEAVAVLVEVFGYSEGAAWQEVSRARGGKTKPELASPKKRIARMI
ncbi:hypothetical protein [Meiothermus hypogaeus]|uniref:Uncharacterized protein n=2 Tax=Meiothermus hypogaeus TaxID=884155 RepID=A0A511R3T0_9DEIN|nr:hypothetical protein [Meiothermus hypogaeus]RIH77664.1 hypothetical protein Mhypo_01938 [Meiothermus hypogaeus]GEM83666.1 hypothetical protein MHY01S_18320 [Meiothermus hypogaeus NBRC 106114]